MFVFLDVDYYSFNLDNVNIVELSIFNFDYMMEVEKVAGVGFFVDSIDSMLWFGDFLDYSFRVEEVFITAGGDNVGV